MQAFTLTSRSGLMKRLNTNIHVNSNYRDDQKNYDNSRNWNAVWDTGATQTCISKVLCNELGLIPIGQATTGTAGGLIDVNTYFIDIILPNGLNIVNLVVMEVDLSSSGCDVLLGMDVITYGDFSITNHKLKTIFSFRTPSLKHVDYVHDSDIMEEVNQQVAPTREDIK